MKILLVEDDEGLAHLTIDNLTKNKQYIIEWSKSGYEGLELAKSYEYDVILLDVELPQLDGIEVCRQIRDSGLRTPILLLTASDQISKKVAGLDAGADDYLVKPFDLRELLARIRALSRRGSDILLPVLQWENLSLDPNNCQVTYEGKSLKLTAKEYALLELFLRHPQRLFSQSSLLDKIWSWEESPSENAVRTQIKGLRHKLRDAGINRDTIETVYGLGYRLSKAPEQELAEDNLVLSASNSQSQQQHNLNRSLDLIWQKYESQYRDRISVLQKAAQAIERGSLSVDLQQQAINTAHILIGSLGSFGYTDSSQICSQIETILLSYEHQDREISDRLEQLLAILLNGINSPPPGLSSGDTFENPTLGNDKPNLSPSALPSQYKLLIVDDDCLLAQALVSEAITWGIEARVAGNIALAREEITGRHPPDAILLDLSFPESRNGGLELLQELSDRKLTIPVIALTARESFDDRIEVARLGGKGFLTKPLSPSQALENVASILEQSHIDDAKVLVVDNQAENIAAIADILEPWGLEVIGLQDTKDFWETLEQSNPDLIVSQLQMEEVSGIDLCRVIRNDPRWCHLPILVISAEDDLETIQQICSVGVDDRISFPVIEEELLARIFNRLDKERYRRQLADTDPLTGISNRRSSIKRLNRLLRIAKRQNRSWCFVVIDLDDFKQINDVRGHDIGDRVLRRLGQLLKQEFRSEDTIARWGGEEFILGLYDTTKELALPRLTSFLQTFRQQSFTDSSQEEFQVTFSAGVAEYPIDGHALESLYQSADVALYRAKAQGKNRVV